MKRSDMSPVLAVAESPGANLQGIAQELNVSVSLVSKVLNNRLGTSRVSAATLNAIREHAKGSGYRKNHSAVALANGRQNAIGVFLHSLGVPGSGLLQSMVEAIAEQASKYDQRLMLQFFSTEEEFSRLRRWLHRGLMDGAVIAGVPHRELTATLLETQRAGVPIVTFLDNPLDHDLVNIATDQHAVGEIATEHLIGQGCRQIAHIRVMPERYEGYKSALAAAGMAYRPELVFAPSRAGPENGYGYAAGEAAVRQFLDQHLKFDGLVAQSDQQAVGALHTLVRAGLRVPEDVKIIGVDNSPFCKFSLVPLSSISQEERCCARKAVQMLMDLISGNVAESAQVRPVIHVRRSSESGK
jgi:LacI family transcriptional regulator